MDVLPFPSLRMGRRPLAAFNCGDEQSVKCREHFTTALAGPKGVKHGSLKYTHVVLYGDKIQVDAWDTDDVLRDYHKLHKGTLLNHQYMKGNKLSPDELISFDETVERYRQRLYDSSWFMLNCIRVMGKAKVLLKQA